jgi:hypothetical protein
MSNRIYDIGHVNPDTDTIAFAMGYTWLLLILNDLCHRPLSDSARDAVGVVSRKKTVVAGCVGVVGKIRL